MRTAIYVCLTAVALTACNDAQEPAACVPPLPGWATPETKKGDYFIWNTVSLGRDGIRWNGKAIDEPTLVQFTRKLAPSSPLPFLIFDPGPSPNCSFGIRVRDILDQNYPCRDGGCGQGPAAEFIPR